MWPPGRVSLSRLGNPRIWVPDHRPESHRTFSYKFKFTYLYLSEIAGYFYFFKRTNLDEQGAGYLSFSGLVCTSGIIEMLRFTHRYSPLDNS